MVKVEAGSTSEGQPRRSTSVSIYICVNIILTRPEVYCIHCLALGEWGCRQAKVAQIASR
jgi:hypothetical protein